MKKIISIWLLLLVFNSYGQYSIEYIFPPKVETEIAHFIKLNNNKKLYMVFDKTSPNEYFISILIQENSIEKLLKVTNRFVKITGKTIPIIFQSDTDFLFLGKDDRGRIRRRAVMYHGYEILFTYNGEIIKTNPLIGSQK